MGETSVFGIPFGVALIVSIIIGLGRWQAQNAVRKNTEEAVKAALAARDAEYKYRCPDCAEPVREGARICKSCRYELTGYFTEIAKQRAEETEALEKEKEAKRAAEQSETARQVELAASRRANVRSMAKRVLQLVSKPRTAILIGASFVLIISAAIAAMTPGKAPTDEWRSIVSNCNIPDDQLNDSGAERGVLVLGIDTYAGARKAAFTCFGNAIGFSNSDLEQFWLSAENRPKTSGNVTLSKYGTRIMFKWIR